MSRKSADKGKHWTDRDKLKAIAAFAATGNASEVEKLTGIPAGTVNYWKTLPWWFDEMEKLRRSEDEELISKHTKIIKQTLEKLETRIETGDLVITKTGEEVLVPIKAKDLGTIANALGQRREKLRENHTEEHVRQITVAERLKQLEDQFTKFVTSKVVEGEVIHKVVEIGAPEVKDAIEIEETRENDDCGSQEPQVCEESGDSSEGGEGVSSDGQEEKGFMLNA